MSYCRFFYSDVYLYHCVTNEIVCDGCRLGGGLKSFATRSAAIAHLEEHRRAGHDVPEEAFERLRAEIGTIGDAVTEEVGE